MAGERQWPPQPQLPPQQPPNPRGRAAEAGLLAGAVSREHRELPLRLLRPAVGARRSLVVADELLEVRLAAHADVFVDRHRRLSATNLLRDARRRDRALRRRTAAPSRYAAGARYPRGTGARQMKTSAHDRASCGVRSRRRVPGVESGSSRRWARSTPVTSRCSRPPATECDVVVASVFVNPAQFADRRDLDAYPRDLERDERAAADAGRRPAVRAVGRRALPARVRDLGRAGRRRRRARGRAPARSLPRRRDRLPEALHDRPARSSPTSGARTHSRSRW